MAATAPAGQSAIDTAADDQVLQDLSRLFAGEAVPVTSIDFRRKDAMQFVPKTKVNVGYIVMTVLFNDRNQVLMVQEAKENCSGSWYLPAGRLEPNENLVDGAVREVSEESGIECQITNLLSVHFGSARWIRFAFIGNIIGGRLKTLAERDNESLQAEFYDVSSVFNWKIELRSGDIISVIHHALEYKESLAKKPLQCTLLPAIASHTLLLHRFVLVVEIDKGSEMYLLVATKGQDKSHLITAAIAPKDPSLTMTLHAVIRESIAGETFFPTIHGILGVEHFGLGGANDGMCLTTLVSLAVPEKKGLPAMRDKVYSWVQLTDESLVNFVKKGMDGGLTRLIEKAT